MLLSELGELELLKQHILPTLALSAADFNNDCVSMLVQSGETLLWTIDPMPIPLAWSLGETDPAILGWYAVTINLSDIAANGGAARGILASVELPSSTELDFYLRLHEGIQEAGRAMNAPLLGGNLKTSNEVRVTASAIGAVKGNLLTRRGIEPGHQLFVLGRTGYFWAAVLARLNGIGVSANTAHLLNSALMWPHAQLKAGALLSNLPFPVACMDSSDGILNCLHQLATINEVDIALREGIWSESLPSEVRRIYETAGVECDTACYSWGEWQLVCAVADIHAPTLIQACRVSDIPVMHVATAIGIGGVVHSDSTWKVLNERLLNERFRELCNETDVQAMADYFLRQPMFVSPVATLGRSVVHGQ